MNLRVEDPPLRSPPGDAPPLVAPREAALVAEPAEQGGALFRLPTTAMRRQRTGRRDDPSGSTNLAARRANRSQQEARAGVTGTTITETAKVNLEIARLNCNLTQSEKAIAEEELKTFRFKLETARIRQMQEQVKLKLQEELQKVRFILETARIRQLQEQAKLKLLQVEHDATRNRAQAARDQALEEVRVKLETASIRELQEQDKLKLLQVECDAARDKALDKARERKALEAFNR